ncbi:MAG: ParB/RepB/Spo0J family partition protein [Desulfovibrionaceae bacterium]|nr:ParB/RepB/Spo0J family partition protein [Desulfovibrionaceae bacterium]
MTGHDAKAETNQYEIGEQYSIPLDQIDINELQPRKYFDDEALEALTKSIEADGLLQAISVKKNGDRFLLVAGERRFRAFQNMGRTEIPARIVSGNSEDLALVENLLRDDLSPMEKAIALKQYRERNPRVRGAKLQERFNLAKSTISEILSLNRLPADIQQELLEQKQYSLHDLKKIAGKRDEQAQREGFRLLKEKVARRSGIAVVKKRQQGSGKEFNIKNAEFRLTKIREELEKYASYSPETLETVKKYVDDVLAAADLLRETVHFVR